MKSLTRNLILIMAVLCAPAVFSDPNPRPTLPDFELSQLDGTPWKLSGITGRPTLIMFWATWCPYCKDMFPVIQNWHDTYDNVEFVAISAFDDGDIAAYQASYGLTMTILIEGDALAERLRIPGTPTIVVLNAEHEVVFGGVNPAKDDPRLLSAIETVAQPR